MCPRFYLHWFSPSMVQDGGVNLNCTKYVLGLNPSGQAIMKGVVRKWTSEHVKAVFALILLFSHQSNTSFIPYKRKLSPGM